MRTWFFYCTFYVWIPYERGSTQVQITCGLPGHYSILILQEPLLLPIFSVYRDGLEGGNIND